MKKISKIIFVFFLVLIIQSAYIYHENIVNHKTKQVEIANLKIEQKEEKIKSLEVENKELLILLETKQPSRQKVIILEKQILITPTPTPTETPKQEIKETESIKKDDTFKWFSYLLMKEAGGEGDEIQLAVGQVIINRSKTYKMTITETVFEKNSNGRYVFSPLASDSFYSTKTTQKIIDNSKYLLSGGSYSLAKNSNTLYFCTSEVYKPGNWHYDYSVGSKKHTIKEDFRLKTKDGRYVIFFSLLN